MPDARFTLRDESGAAHAITLAPGGEVTIGDVTLRVRRFPDGSLVVEGAHNVTAWAAAVGDTRWVFVAGRVFTFEVDRPGRPRARGAAHVGPLTAPMPATVRKLAVSSGDAVRRGDVLIVLEAMKMELPVRAAVDGVVSAVHCQEGDLVQANQELIEVRATE